MKDLLDLWLSRDLLNPQWMLIQLCNRLDHNQSQEYLIRHESAIVTQVSVDVLFDRFEQRNISDHEGNMQQFLQLGQTSKRHFSHVFQLYGFYSK
jgi:hypothetical protein